ncbi:DUF5344 family protein [Sporolactobacillus sp. Y61]|uniref:DUF5344 family protein n=1 Tax=Sporolactobacillus sp. Y61 TaxID=3160863 RepID=A0AAU8ID22_9BACL
MGQIALNHGQVSGRLDEAKAAANQLSLKDPSGRGSNRLAITTDWESKEAMVQQLLTIYIEGLQNNIADTKANVDLLKRQDEVIR